MDRRILLLPLAAIVIAALCVYRVNHPRTSVSPTQRALQCNCPTFELYDSASQLVRVESYLHRHSVLFVFFDGSQGADQVPLLQQLYQVRERLRSNRVMVLGINRVLPQENEAAWKKLARSSPTQTRHTMLLLSDIDGRVHTQWGLDEFPESGSGPVVFLADPTGQIACDSSGQPQPVENIERQLSLLIGGL